MVNRERASVRRVRADGTDAILPLQQGSILRQSPTRTFMEQFDFQDFRRPAAFGNRGKSFERMIERANAIYQVRGVAHVSRNENVWQSASARIAERLPGFMWARTGDGKRFLVMHQSDVDYSGVVRGGRALIFDAKEFQGTSLPLRAFRPHQVELLCSAQRCGAVAGFLVYNTDTGQAFWLRAAQVREALDKTVFARKGRGIHPKSFSLGWLAKNAVVVGVWHSGAVADYLDALLRGAA